MNEVIIVGAGIGGLSLALSLHAAGVEARVYEAAAELKPLGVGINLLPHAVRELTELGLGEALARSGVETEALVYANRFGQRLITLKQRLGTISGRNGKTECQSRDERSPSCDP